MSRLCVNEESFVKRILLYLLCTALLLCSCAQEPAPSQQEDGRVSVVVTVFPAYDFARTVAGEHATVKMLLPPGMESHSYEPTPADILAVQNCDLFICLGGESDAWVNTILSAVEPKGEILRMVDCVELLEETHAEGMQMSPGHDHDGHDHTEDEDCTEPEEHVHTEEEEDRLHEEHDHEEHAEEIHEENAHEDEAPSYLGAVVGMDEHVWTSPRNAAEITLEIGGLLAELDPENSRTYLANAERYAAEINALDREFETFFESLPHRTIVFGDRFPLLYFADRYDLDYYAAFPGCGTQTEPSAATIAFLTEKVRNEQIPTVWDIEFSNHLVADSIAEATERQTAMFHTCHNVTRAEMDAGATYLSLMEQNLATLKANFA